MNCRHIKKLDERLSMQWHQICKLEEKIINCKTESMNTRKEYIKTKPVVIGIAIGLIILLVRELLI